MDNNIWEQGCVQGKENMLRMRTRSENLQGDGEEVTLQRQAVQVGISRGGGWQGWHRPHGWHRSGGWDQDSDKWKKSGSERCLGGTTMLKMEASLQILQKERK